MSVEQQITLTARQGQLMKQVAQMIAWGDNNDAILARWENFVIDAVSNNASVDINTLVQEVIREAYLQNTEDLRFYAEKVKYFNEAKKAVREYIQKLHDAQAGLIEHIRQAELEMQSLDDGSALTASEYEESIQRAQQRLLTSPTLQESMRDSALEVIRNLPSLPTPPSPGEEGAGETLPGPIVWAGHGLPGQAVFELAIDPLTPTTMYAVPSTGEVFKSTDGGKNWNASRTGLPALGMDWATVLAIDPLTPTTIYVGTQCNGVFKSTNGGEYWRGSVLWGAVKINDLAIDPATPTTIYAAADTGLYKNTDGGDIWLPVSLGVPDIAIGALAIDPVKPTTIYAGTATDGVFKSTDGGKKWDTASTGLTGTNVRALAIDPLMPTTLYAGTENGGVFKSTDGGDSWNAANTGLTELNVFALVIDPATPSTLYVSTHSNTGENQVFISTNGGENWSPVGVDN